MKKKDLFKDRTPEEAKEMLLSNNYLMEERDITIPLTKDEIQELKGIIAKDSSELYDIQKKKAAKVAEFNAELKPLKEVVKANSLTFKDGSKTEFRVLYGLDNQDDGTMDFYLEDGSYHSSRRLYPAERQLIIGARKIG